LIPAFSERALILAPIGRDAEVAAMILAGAHIRAMPCGSIGTLVAELRAGAGFAIVTEEALQEGDLTSLHEWIGGQPEWSDFPFILLVRSGGGIERNPAARRQLQLLGNVTFLERPFHPTTLVSLARSALRGRRRQYDARARLDSLRQSEEALERQVGERTAALRAGEARMRAIFETNHQYQGLVSLDGILLDANRTSLEGIEARLEDVVGRPFWDTPWFTATPSVPEAVRLAVAKVAGGETIQEEIHLQLPSGWRTFDFTMRPVRDADGAVMAIVPEAVDITERRQAEEALRQSQKLEAMGQLTGGVAHDFNNLLTPIVGSLDMLYRQGLGNERQRRLIEGALQSADRAKVLVQRLLAFARRQPLQPIAVDVSQLVRDIAELVASTTGPQINLIVSAPDDLPPALADPNQLEMAVLNLSVNARDAMAAGGTLRITVSEETLGPLHPTRLRTGRYIRLSVADTGEGMDDATLARAVEPFFSTKGIGKGTGLGLSMVHGLASQLEGALTISSKLGVGTIIDLWLPVTSMPSEGQPEGSIILAPRHEGTVLLVDDEALVRASTAQMLHEIGFSIVEAASAEEALEKIDDGLQFDLLVTDHLMPGMTGTDLVGELVRRGREVAVVIVSGYAEAEEIAADLPRITKPFRLEDLATIIRTVLCAPAHQA
jgi:PAS domain S-box-containing protein